MTFTKKQIESQEDFVKAISYQKESATNAYYEAKAYMDRISSHYNDQVKQLNYMKKETN